MRRLSPLVASLAVLACSQVREAPRATPRVSLSDETGLGLSQTLFRVRYQGPAGSGSLRLVLRLLAEDRFQLQAADSFGRAVWSLDLAGDEVLMVDHRGREACISGAELRVPEVALRPLPLPAVARVLAGLPPLAVRPGADETDWVDDSGQRWTARWVEGSLAAWTLWQAGEPQLWWSRQARGGVLSHRDGSQFRWRQTASEAMADGSYSRLEAPAGYRFGTCRPLESATGGGG